MVQRWQRFRPSEVDGGVRPVLSALLCVCVSVCDVGVLSACSRQLINVVLTKRQGGARPQPPEGTRSDPQVLAVDLQLMAVSIADQYADHFTHLI